MTGAQCRVVALLCLECNRWMFPGGVKRFAQINHAGTIQPQSRQGGATSRRHADDEREIPIPGEMFVPWLKTGMKQRDELFGQRINRFNFDVLVAVATLAGQGQVVSRRRAAFFQRDDVFDGE